MLLASSEMESDSDRRRYADLEKHYAKVSKAYIETPFRGGGGAIWFMWVVTIHHRLLPREMRKLTAFIHPCPALSWQSNLFLSHFWKGGNVPGAFFIDHGPLPRLIGADGWI
jgi:hypothetical protein